MKYQVEVAKELLKEYECIIEQLKESKVVTIDWYKGNECFYIGEKCDGWYDMKLSKEDCIILSELFSKMANFYDILDDYEKEKSYEEELKEIKLKEKLEKEKNEPKPKYRITKDYWLDGSLVKTHSENVFDDLLYIDTQFKSNGYIIVDGNYECHLDSGEVIKITIE